MVLFVQFCLIIINFNGFIVLMASEAENKFQSGRKILAKFPYLNELQDQDIKLFANTAIFQKFPAGKVLYKEGDPCNFFALINEGVVRVYKTSDTGNEITLYRVGSGECCFLTASCVMQETKFPAIAVAEEELEAVMLPSSVLQDWVGTNPVWRKYVFSLLASRLSNVAERVDDVAFQRIDKRLAEFMLNKHKDNIVSMTHQAIALDLGTAREVVSRILKELEKDGVVQILRGKTEITDLPALTKIAEGFCRKTEK